jgi:Gpi18-like mannosyltransferase
MNIKSHFNKTLKYVLNRDFLLALAVTIAVIIGAMFLGWYNNKVVPISTNTYARYTAEPNNHLSFISNWDGPDYINISHVGYTNTEDTNFFPLYPLLIHLVNMVIDSSLYSALLISWASLVGATYFFLKVIKKLYKIKYNQDAFKGLLLFVLFPTAVFLVATYTESLFAFLALAAIYYLLEKRYIISAFFALFASATHITGIFLIVLLALMMYEQKVKIKKILAYLIISSLGLLAYITFLYNNFSKPFAFITAQKSHGWLQTNYIHNITTTFSIDNIFFLALLLIAAIYWWSRKKSFSIYTLLFLLIPLAGGQFGGFDRYTLMAFPIYFMLYEKFHNKSMSYTLMLVVFAIAWTYTLLQYTGGYTGS